MTRSHDRQESENSQVDKCIKFIGICKNSGTAPSLDIISIHPSSKETLFVLIFLQISIVNTFLEYHKKYSIAQGFPTWGVSKHCWGGACSYLKNTFLYFKYLFLMKGKN